MVAIQAGVTVSAQREFHMARVIGKSFAIFFRNFIVFSLVALAVWVPMLIVFGVILLLTKTNWGLNAIGAYLSWDIFAGAIAAGTLASVLLYPISAGIILNAAFQHMRNGRPRIITSIKRGFARALWLILVSLLALLAIAAIAGVVALLGYLVLAGINAVAADPISLYFLTWAPMIALAAAPGIFFLAVMWSVAMPACLIERLGPIASLERSRSLTKGHRWKISAILLICVIVVFIPPNVIDLVLGATLGNTWKPWLTFAFQSIADAFLFVVPAVIYHDLLLVNEGVDIQKLATVFD